MENPVRLSHSDGATEETSPHTALRRALFLSMGLVGVLVFLMVLIRGDFVGEHAVAGGTGLWVVDIGYYLHRRFVKAARLSDTGIVDVRAVGFRLERCRSLRIRSGRGDRRRIRAGGTAVREAGRSDGVAESSGVRVGIGVSVLGRGLARAGAASRSGRSWVSSRVRLVPATLLLAMSHLLDVALINLAAKGLKEVVELAVEVLFSDAKVPLEQEEKLLLHQVDLSTAEAKIVHLSVDVRVVGPVFVFGRAVIEILGSENERGEEDAVGGTS